MAHNPITLDLLKALDAIDRRGSFAAAAQALHKVPSALTYTIQKVEQDLNLSLFDRSGHRAKLTPAGKLILDQGRMVLREIDSLANSAKKLASGWEAKITIAIDTLLDTTSIFPLVEKFNKDHSFVRVNLTRGSLSGTWEQLLNQKADLKILAR
ncbi:MAG: LysR family transcriptional regulator [Reinekea sp.]